MGFVAGETPGVKPNGNYEGVWNAAFSPLITLPVGYTLTLTFQTYNGQEGQERYDKLAVLAIDLSGATGLASSRTRPTTMSGRSTRAGSASRTNRATSQISITSSRSI